MKNTKTNINNTNKNNKTNNTIKEETTMKNTRTNINKTIENNKTNKEETTMKNTNNTNKNNNTNKEETTMKNTRTNNTSRSVKITRKFAAMLAAVMAATTMASIGASAATDVNAVVNLNTQNAATAIAADNFILMPLLEPFMNMPFRIFINFTGCVILAYGMTIVIISLKQAQALMIW